MNDDVPGPAPAHARASRGLLAAEDLKNLRLRRAMARAAGGILDLVMPMRVGGDGPPLFCAHPVVGLSWCYLALLPHVDARYPLYGLQARGLRRPEPLPTSIEEMARDYADHIRETQPSGPYHLLGMSLGGNVAFAIAEELERRGERIGLLVILDSTLVDLDVIEIEPWAIYNLVLAQFGYAPALAEKLESWRPFVDGPIEAVELDCDHRYMLLPEPIARIGPALSRRMACAAAASTA